jgi:hypothetical protein
MIKNKKQIFASAMFILSINILNAGKDTPQATVPKEQTTTKKQNTGIFSGLLNLFGRNENSGTTELKNKLAKLENRLAESGKKLVESDTESISPQDLMDLKGLLNPDIKALSELLKQSADKQDRKALIKKYQDTVLKLLDSRLYKKVFNFINKVIKIINEDNQQANEAFLQDWTSVINFANENRNEFGAMLPLIILLHPELLNLATNIFFNSTNPTINTNSTEKH